jgi:methionyl aminopeptidase
MASAARALGYTPYWMDLNSYKDTTCTKVIGAQNDLYSLGSRLSQKIKLFNKIVWEPLNYEGFPMSVCTSINDEVCHGIPSPDIILKDGDIVNVDCSTNLNGYFSDSSRMFCIGEVSEDKKRLVNAAKQALDEGLKEVKPWGFLGDMGQAVNDYIKSMGYSVVREVGGHGIGLEFHEDPWVSYVSVKNTEMLMVPGMMFTIEPMINMGKPNVFTDEENGWTIYTEDGSPSAQWEIQVLVTEDGYEIISY